jgi:hypothetical protein
MLCMPDTGQVLELTPDGKTRWQLSGFQILFDAQVLPGDRVLLAELGLGRVTERNTKNDILWEKRVVQPVGCQRLRNGNTFIVTLQQLMEVDRTGREVFTRPANGMNYMGATKLRNGDIIFVTTSGICQRLDASGKELKSFHLNGQVQYGGLEALPNGHVLIAHTYNNRVTEYDGDGKEVWTAQVPQPTCATRLANGHTLIGSQYPGRAVELDREGRPVWEYNGPGNQRVNRVRRR